MFAFGFARGRPLGARAPAKWLNPRQAGISADGSRFALAAKTPQFATLPRDPPDPPVPLKLLKNMELLGADWDADPPGIRLNPLTRTVMLPINPLKSLK